MGLSLLALLNGLMLGLLFLGASVGHTSLVVLSHNWWYGTVLPRRVSDLVQVLHGLLVLAGPIAFWYGYGFDLTSAFTSWPGSVGHLLGTSYISICWLVGFVLMPVITLRHRLHARTAALIHNHTDTIDMTQRLGYRPAGDSGLRFLTRLPGNQVFQVDFAERLLRMPNLPEAWEGLSILHLTDLHMCGTPDKRFFQEVIDRCNEWEPDLVAVTGDIVDSDYHRRWILPVLGRLRWKIAGFSILGNHDLWWEPAQIRRRLNRCGLKVLGNGWVQVDVRGLPMVVIGHEGPWILPEPDLSGCPADVFRLLLSHTPDNIPWARQNHINLMLSGHNHGGQIRFPLIGSVLIPSRYSRRYDCGLFDESPTLLHVSKGLGGEHPVRFNCRPEAVKIVLQKG